MNVYDFDETILKGDSEDYFFLFCEKNVKFSLIHKIIYKHYTKAERSRRLPFSKTRIKRYCILKDIPNLNSFLEDFWDEHECFIKKWYLDIKSDDDVIESATPRFLLEPIIKRLGIKNLIATDLDPIKVKLISNWNYGEFKVKSFCKNFNDIIPDVFYSDSDSDLPLAKYSKKAIKVDGDNLFDWVF